MLYLVMVFMHIVDDFYLQGILASMKQKKWWELQSEYKEMYKNDYIIALMIHSFSWAFMIMLPIMIINNFEFSMPFYIIFTANAIIHGIVDNLKANHGKINLVTDQTIHHIQIFITSILSVFI